MKKLLLLFAVILFAACSSDTEDAPKDGQYVYQSSNWTVSIVIKKAVPKSITVFKNGYIVFISYEYAGTDSDDTWPTYRYFGSSKNPPGYIELTCVYSSRKSFSATVTETSCKYGEFDGLPTNLVFRYDNTELDANGDIILDSWEE
jgi:hypothetical protein